MATAAAPQASGSSAATENPCPGSSGSATSDSSSQDSTFECNICLDTAKDAVISLCGHLFWYGLLSDRAFLELCIILHLLYY